MSVVSKKRTRTAAAVFKIWCSVFELLGKKMQVKWSICVDYTLLFQAVIGFGLILILNYDRLCFELLCFSTDGLKILHNPDQ